MSARLARTAFTSAVRRAQPTARLATRRTMSSSSHGAQAKSSDTPWIIGSSLVFLPAFLYLVSPSARKTEHLVHDDKHDFPALKHEDSKGSPKQQEDSPVEPASTEKAPEPTEKKEQNEDKAESENEDSTEKADKEEKTESAPSAQTMTDDEGTVADVGSSIAVAEGADSPKSAQTPEAQSENLAAAEDTPAAETKTEA